MAETTGEMETTNPEIGSTTRRRAYGEHLTSPEIFYKFILPHIRNHLHRYTWVDLFAGEGNLILPILGYIPRPYRIGFFQKRMFLFDIQGEMVKKCVAKAKSFGIPECIARRNILQWDTLRQFPPRLLRRPLPIYHITNPPYLYIGYIVKRGGRNLSYFNGMNAGYQDLYQLALMNDLRNDVENMIYIIPTNFLFGDSGANKIRNDFLKFYEIQKAYLFEEKIFEHTGTNVGIFFFNRKRHISSCRQEFTGVKIRNGTQTTRKYVLKPENEYRAGGQFEEFLRKCPAPHPIECRFYLTSDMIRKNPGDQIIRLIDANTFDGKTYARIQKRVSAELKNKVQSNILFVRTVDTGSSDGRCGLYEIKSIFGVDGIYTERPFRTHPIQIFFHPELDVEDQRYLKKYFQQVLEYFREADDSEFMTTFRYSHAEYTRKYLGLTSVKRLVRTCPLLDLHGTAKSEFVSLLLRGRGDEIVRYVADRHRASSSDLFCAA